jgi:hypothetical protein
MSVRRYVLLGLNGLNRTCSLTFCLFLQKSELQAFFSAARGEVLLRMQASGIPQKLKGLCHEICVLFYGP